MPPFLSLAQFQQYLASPSEMSYKTFVKMARVRMWNGDTVLLSDFRVSHPYISSNDLKNLYDHIVTHGEYITRLYDISLKVDVQSIVGLLKSQEAMRITELNNSTFNQSKSIIRNMFWREIMRETKTDLHTPTFLSVLEDLYVHGIIHHKILAPTALDYLARGRIGTIFSFYYFRASILNPFVVYSLQKRLFMSKRVFTPTLGWGSYFYGFAEGGVKEYVGVDVIPNVCKRVSEFAHMYYPDINTHIMCEPSESLLSNKVFLRKYHEYFDTVFFSPPYYRLELYSGGPQSTNEYPDYSSWLDGYIRKTLRVCYHVLASGGKLCYILGNYSSNDLLKDVRRVVLEEGFQHKRTISMNNRKIGVRANMSNLSEKIVIYQK